MRMQFRTGIFLMTFCLAPWLIPVSKAQDSSPDTTGMNAFVQKVKRAYEQAGRLAFTVKYLYANAGQPDLYLDSLTGQVEMDRNRSRLIIDGMETVLTGQYAIQVMGEDKAIYISKARPTSAMNPLNTLDSIFFHIQGVKVTLRHQGSSEVLTLSFPPGQAYNGLEIRIDEKTGFFQKISYALNTAGLVGQEMIESPGHPGPYQSRGQVDIVFLDYHKGGPDDRVFREDNYFNKVADHYEAAGRYKDYHIFLASPNL